MIKDLGKTKGVELGSRLLCGRWPQMSYINRGEKEK